MAGVFAQQHPEDVLTVKATTDIAEFHFVDVQTGQLGTSVTQKLGIAQHAAQAGEVVTVATGGLCAVRAGTGFNFADQGTAVYPRYTFSGTMAATFAAPGTSGQVIVGTSAAASVGVFAQGEWASPPSAANPQLTNIVWF